MKDNFDASLAHVLVHEGGYVNHPEDPGGATNKGVTQVVYNSWRAKKGLALRSVKDIESDEVAAIYKREYWDRVKGDELPSGLDYAVFDFAVNSGVGRASKYLQRVVNVTPDGQIGPATIAACKCGDVSIMIEALCNARQVFLEGLSTFSTFGKGWTRRVAGVEEAAKGMV